MKKFTLSALTLACAFALSACSSSSKGGVDNSAQIQKSETELKQQLAKLEEKLEEAQANALVAQNKLKTAHSQTQAEKEAAAKRLQELESLQADERARIPLSSDIFGGVDGAMKKSLAGLSGGVWTQTDDQWNEAVLPASTEGINDIFIIEKSGKAKHAPLVSASWRYVGQGDYYSPAISSNDAKFPDVRFGSYIDGLDGSVAVYSQGYATAVEQVPTSGTAVYKGGITHQQDDDSSSVGGGNGLVANVDFGNKTIDFNVAEDKYNNVPQMNFAAKITANSFAGDVGGIKTQGGFYGENASQLSGLYQNTNDNSRGAYGAVKEE